MKASLNPSPLQVIDMEHTTTTLRRVGTQSALIILACYALSIIFGVPYLFTLIGASLWVLLDHLVIEDDEDDFLFDWHSPCTTVRLSWYGIGLRLLLLVMLCFIAIQFPALRSLGA